EMLRSQSGRRRTAYPSPSTQPLVTEPSQTRCGAQGAVFAPTRPPLLRWQAVSPGRTPATLARGPALGRPPSRRICVVREATLQAMRDRLAHASLRVEESYGQGWPVTNNSLAGTVSHHHPIERHVEPPTAPE